MYVASLVFIIPRTSIVFVVLLLHLHSLQLQDARFHQLPARSPVKESDPVLLLFLLLRLQVLFALLSSPSPWSPL